MTKMLLAAHAVFSRYGISKTTMNDIAKEAGVARQTLYNAFENKETVLRAVMRFFADQALEEIRSDWANRSGLDEKIDAYYALGPLKWYDQIQASPESADLLDGIHSIAKEEVLEYGRKWTAEIEELFKQHAAPGSPAHDDPAAVADFFYATSQNVKKDATDRDNLVQRFAILKLSVLSLAGL